MLGHDPTYDLYERLRAALRRLHFGASAADALARELSVWACALFIWRQPAHRSGRTFTVHRRSQYATVLAVILFVGMVETAGVHVLLRRGAPVLACVLTGLGIYGMLWLFGDYRALGLRPVVLHDGMLLVRVGLRAQARIALAAVERVEAVPPAGEPDRQAPEYARCTAFGPPALLLRLREPATIERMLGGSTKRVSCIGLTIDDEVAFRSALQAVTSLS
jgi:hypothetical protein